MTDITLLYIVDNYHGSDEFGMYWNDRQLNIGWSLLQLALSERDKNNPLLADIRPEQRQE